MIWLPAVPVLTLFAIDTLKNQWERKIKYTHLLEFILLSDRSPSYLIIYFLNHVHLAWLVQVVYNYYNNFY